MKAQAGNRKAAGFAYGGEKITYWIMIGKARYPLTDKQWERRMIRLKGEGK